MGSLSIRNLKGIIFIIFLIMSWLYYNFIPDKTMSRITCSDSTCKIEEFNNEGKLKETRTITANTCSSFFVYSKNDSLYKAVRYATANSHSARRDSRNESLYTVGCVDRDDGISHPLFDTYTKNRRKTEDAVHTISEAFMLKPLMLNYEFKKK